MTVQYASTTRAALTTTRATALVVVLAGAQFLVVLDSLAVALALPAIGADLGLAPAGLAWVVNAYSLALVAGLLLAGRLSDTYGRRPVLQSGVVLLSVGAVLAGLAPTGEVLLGARVVQGLGGALAYPPALALTAEAFPADPWRSRAFTAGAVAGASATVVGAVFGGTVTGQLGWTWVFLLTVPPGLLLLGLGALVLPAPPARVVGRCLDLRGAALVAASVVMLVLTLARIDPHGLADPLLQAGAVVVVVLLGALVLVERRSPDPLVPLSLVRSRRLAGGCLAIAANSALYSAVVFTTTLQLQSELRLSPTRAGLAFLPVSAASLLVGALAVTRLRRRFGSLPVAVGGLLLGALALTMLAGAPAAPSYPSRVLPALVLVGLALTAAFVSLTEHTLGGRGSRDRGVVAGVFETSTHLGGALSVATYASLIGVHGYRAAHAAGAVVLVAGATALLLLTRRRQPAW